MSGRELAYQSAAKAASNWKKGMLFGSAVLIASSVTVGELLLPTSIGLGHGRLSLTHIETFGWVGTYMRTKSEYLLAGGVTTTREFFGWGIVSNDGLLAVVWGGAVGAIVR